MEDERGRCPHPECGRVFKDLKAHMLTHSAERPEKGSTANNAISQTTKIALQDSSLRREDQHTATFPHRAITSGSSSIHVDPRNSALPQAGNESAESEMSLPFVGYTYKRFYADDYEDFQINDKDAADAETSLSNSKLPEPSKEKLSGQANPINPSPPTFVKVHRNDVLPHTLNVYGLPWEWDAVSIVSYCPTSDVLTNIERFRRDCH
jgi:hypothetical protein